MKLFMTTAVRTSDSKESVLISDAGANVCKGIPENKQAYDVLHTSGTDSPVGTATEAAC
jgi:hypothetical protein